MHPVRAFLRRFAWIHIGLGLLGNLSFFAGSLMFLSADTHALGVWAFIVGSFGMLVDSIGSALLKRWEDGH